MLNHKHKRTVESQLEGGLSLHWKSARHHDCGCSRSHSACLINLLAGTQVKLEAGMSCDRCEAVQQGRVTMPERGSAQPTSTTALCRTFVTYSACAIRLKSAVFSNAAVTPSDCSTVPRSELDSERNFGSSTMVLSGEWTCADEACKSVTASHRGRASRRASALVPYARVHYYPPTLGLGASAFPVEIAAIASMTLLTLPPSTGSTARAANVDPLYGSRTASYTPSTDRQRARKRPSNCTHV